MQLDFEVINQTCTHGGICSSFFNFSVSVEEVNDPLNLTFDDNYPTYLKLGKTQFLYAIPQSEIDSI